MVNEDPQTDPIWGAARAPTGLLVLANGIMFEGWGLGATGDAVAEVCFNTAMTGYQEILTDPSYAGQIIAFTFPHIGNVGANDQDYESQTPAARGVILRADITEPSNWRAEQHLGAWLTKRSIIGLCGIDTRRLTRLIREQGMPNAVIAHDPNGQFDRPALLAKAKAWSGLVGLDLAKDVSATTTSSFDQDLWSRTQGYAPGGVAQRHVVVVDYGVKRNILRGLVHQGCKVTVVPAQSDADAVLAHKPDGVLLSNGPGDPDATGTYAVPMIQALLAKGLPIFGICLGHQMLALALGARTEKMPQGHHGANHPVKDLMTGKVEIVSMNHGFTVARESLPPNVVETHVSLFDQTNCGIALRDKPVFSVQYHPEASPGPHDAHYLFGRFVSAIDGQARG